MKNKSLNIKSILGKSQRLWILLAIMLVLTILQPGVFLTVANIKSILMSISIYGIMVCGTISRFCWAESTCRSALSRRRAVHSRSCRS